MTCWNTLVWWVLESSVNWSHGVVVGCEGVWLLRVSEDSLHRGREGAEAAAHGPGRGDEEQRLSLHRSVLRRSLQRGLTQTHWPQTHHSMLYFLLSPVFTVEQLFLSNWNLPLTSVSGGLLDLYGAYVYLIRQILQICILCIRWRHSRGYIRQNNISGESRNHFFLHVFWFHIVRIMKTMTCFVFHRPLKHWTT